MERKKLKAARAKKKMVKASPKTGKVCTESPGSMHGLEEWVRRERAKLSLVEIIIMLQDL